MRGTLEPVCACGHAFDEHDDHGACAVDGCPCFAFEAAADAEES